MVQILIRRLRRELFVIVPGTSRSTLEIEIFALVSFACCFFSHKQRIIRGMGDSNPKNAQKKKAQNDAKKLSNKKQPKQARLVAPKKK